MVINIVRWNLLLLEEDEGSSQLHGHGHGRLTPHELALSHACFELSPRSKLLGMSHDALIGLPHPTPPPINLS